MKTELVHSHAPDEIPVHSLIQPREAAMLSRRSFLQSSLVAGGSLVLPARLFGAQAPSERVRVGFIGTGNQGMGLLK
ncbi:MAG: hypothetical protein C0478_13230, partial [Planctomyces sp.]|nr:hypothetical protein [Planctomyces sp.]